MIESLSCKAVGVRRRATKLFLAALPAVLLAACATPEPVPLPERLDVAYGQGRIWQIDGQGIEPSYVFGTFHISDPRVLDVPAAVETAFTEAEVAAFEYDYGPDKEEENRIDRKRFKLPEDTTLRSIIGNGAFGNLTSIFKGRGYWRPRNDLKPWVMWDYLGGSRGIFYTGDDESDPKRPVLDGWLQERAREEGKTVVGLETVEQGFIKYDSIPMEQQALLLQTVVDNYHRRRQSAPIVQSYLDGDLAMLMAYWDERLSWYPPEVGEMLDHRILTNRNHIFVERSLPWMEKQATFIAVGAGHLPGEEGVLRLFEERGYTVTKLH